MMYINTVVSQHKTSITDLNEKFQLLINLSVIGVLTLYTI
jgi:hypothetical protein